MASTTMLAVPGEPIDIRSAPQLVLLPDPADHCNAYLRSLQLSGDVQVVDRGSSTRLPRYAASWTPSRENAARGYRVATDAGDTMFDALRRVFLHRSRQVIKLAEVATSRDR